jgi:putative acyl-CoA dehydrogenase
VPTIIEMVSATRLDCVLGSAAAMRQGCVAAVHHASWRQAFGKDLISQPLMAAVLADLIVESEAATTLAVRLAGAAERAARGDAQEAALLRVALPAAKHWVCKRAPAHTAEALECLGGNGYIEESGLPRLYREAPLNSIWEGSGNVTALDVLRALARAAAPGSTGPADALLAELDRAAGGDRRLDEACDRLRGLLPGLAATAGPDAEFAARRLAGTIAVTLQAALLVRHAPAAVADAFCASRLGSGSLGSGSLGWGTLSGPGVPFGTLPDDVATGAILDRATASSR